MLHRNLISTALLLCLILVAAGCDHSQVTPVAPTRTLTAARANATYIVQRGSVLKTLEFDGRISPQEEVPLYFETPGYVKQLYVKQGDRVQAGDLLAELETDDLLSQIAQAQASLKSAQLLLSQAQESLEQDIALAELDLSAAQAKLDQAQDANAYAIAQAELSLELAQERLVRAQHLEIMYTASITQSLVGVARAKDQLARAQIENQKSLARPSESQESRDAYARELQSAEWDLEAALAQNDQAAATREANRQDIKILGITVKQAETELEQLKKGVDPQLSLQVQRAQLVLDSAKLDVDPALINNVDRAQLTLDGLQERLTKAQIVAPADGQILYVSIRPGSPVEAFRAVLSIADPSTLEVSAYPSGEQLSAMAEGQPATVVLDSQPDRVWEGTVSRPPSLYRATGEVESGAGDGGSVRISLQGDLTGLTLGSPVSVAIVLEQRDDVLWLPPAAVQTFQGHPFVVVQDGGLQRRTDVEPGIQGADRLEILSGLQEGQVVVAP
jgi:HlyD family secretion protein